MVSEVSEEITPGTLIHRLIIYFVIFNVLITVTVNLISALETLVRLSNLVSSEVSDPVLSFFYSIFSNLYLWLKSVLVEPRNVALMLVFDLILLAFALRPRRGGLFE